MAMFSSTRAKSAAAAYALSLLCPAVLMGAQLTVDSITLKPGESGSVSIRLASQGASVVALQFDLKYDHSNIGVGAPVAGPVVLAAGKGLTCNPVAGDPDTKKCIIFGLNTTPMGDGVVADVPITVAPAAAAGDYPLHLDNVKGSDGASSPIVVDPVDGVVKVPGNPPNITITKTHTGDFIQGQTGAQFTVTVSNGAGAGPTSGAVTVTDTLPAGLTLVKMEGSGWTCNNNTCTRSDALAAGQPYPLTVTVNVAADAPAQVINQASVSGTGFSTATASNTANVIGALSIVAPGSLAVGTVGQPYGSGVVCQALGCPGAVIMASGGTPPYSFAATGLPPQLSINPTTGAITGTPTQAGTFPVTATVTDSVGRQTSKPYSLEIRPAPTVALAVGNASGVPGQTVEVSIALTSSGGAQPAAFQGTLTYDSQKLTLVSARAGEALTAAGKTLSVAGDKLVGAGVNQTTIGDGNVAYATFRLNSAFISGVAPVTLAGCLASTPVGSAIQTVCTGGAVQPFAIRVNAGGPDYKDPDGNLWKADYGFVAGGGTFDTTQAIAGTNAAPLYQDLRWGTPVQYQFGTVPPGNYAVRLKFAELYYNASGQRLFDVTLNGQTSQTGLDVAAQAGGGNAAFDRVYPVTVAADGKLAVLLSPSAGRPTLAGIADSPIVNALEVLPGSALAINKKHQSGCYAQGQTGVTFTLTVSNSITAGPTTGQVLVQDVIPAGMSLTSMSGNGWTCNGDTCSRSDSLAPGASYRDITVVAALAADAPSPLVNTANVAGGGSFTALATDSMSVSPRCDLVVPAEVTLGWPGQTGLFPVTLATPAPHGGVLITLANSDPSIASLVPMNVFIAEGQMAPFQQPLLTAKKVGTTTITASASGYKPASGTVKVTLPAPVNVDILLPADATVAAGKQVDYPVTLANAAGPGGVIVTLAISDTSVVSLSSPFVYFEAGKTTAEPLKLNGLKVGSAIITASSAGYQPSNQKVSVTAP